MVKLWCVITPLYAWIIEGETLLFQEMAIMKWFCAQKFDIK